MNGPARRTWLLPIPALAVAAGTALTILLLAPDRWTPSVKLVLGYLVTPLAKELWVPLGHAGFGLPLWYIAGLLLLVNLSICLFFALAVPVERALQRLPRLGERVRRLEARVNANPPARHGVAVALAVVVALPIHSGGAILGSLAGRTLGLAPAWVVASVMTAITVRTLAVVLLAMGLLPSVG